MKPIIILTAAILSIAATSALAGTRVIDGDTIDTDGRRYRLYGIDAPETAQLCADGWRGGIEATRNLIKLIGDTPVVCEIKDWDRYHRAVAICRAGGVDLNEAQVRGGYAFAYSRYSHQYESAERQAAADRLGVHAHGCQRPWDYRAAKAGAAR